MKIDNNNFIKEMKKKNAKALEFIVDEYSNLIFKITGNVLNSNFHSQNVEECVNDIFWSAWNNIESFDEEKGEFKHWISAIAKYKAIDYKRKLFKSSVVESIDDYDYALSSEDNIESLIIDKENSEELIEAIEKMKDEDKEIFIRRYFLYEGIENIAKSFGVNRNLVDKRLSRGREFLKQKLILLKGEIS
ncbi:RNA polymerase factor sigma-70, ECF23-type [Gottschalkia acidurici 9a]|uniref:RNA polymerase factor sigma-70, ECF23-type n=1 Tax=Gottschalkia acidurici (strain ATCC 7906 / DSM 604 / BCRC 14475 / CIP 104303 / KCTC 5404 / NCIMB 10678 / 9a) TaxID=1128398 RepID=K0B1Y6_GOTA9|nr:sigma-70 family RNA polymerase sigma factor [Gottschalkia acidurici]AFS79127.1 RNA polymerase factor sigma-70, ECF23-type [Gottschalkia acidurici 9a]